MSDVLLMCPSVRFVCPLIDQLIGEYWCMGFGIDTARPCHRRFKSVNRCLRVSASPLIDWSGNDYCCLIYYWCVPPSILSVRWQINQLIDQLINRWILIYDIWNRHGSTINLCPSIRVAKSPLIDQPGNASWCMMYYWCVPPSVLSVRW